jgi:hypothetical protein
MGTGGHICDNCAQNIYYPPRGSLDDPFDCQEVAFSRRIVLIAQPHGPPAASTPAPGSTPHLEAPEWVLPTPWAEPYDVAVSGTAWPGPARSHDRRDRRRSAAEVDQHSARVGRRPHDPGDLLGRQHARRVDPEGRADRLGFAWPGTRGGAWRRSERGGRPACLGLRAARRRQLMAAAISRRLQIIQARPKDHDPEHLRTVSSTGLSRNLIPSGTLVLARRSGWSVAACAAVLESGWRAPSRRPERS